MSIFRITMKISTAFKQPPLSLKSFSLSIALLGLAAAAQAQSYWQSTSSTDPSVAGNWGAPVPTLGAVNADGIFDNGSADIIYTAAFGTTTFGTSAGASGGLIWQGAFFTQNAFRLTGGTVNFSGALSADGGSESVWIGNGGSSVGTITITGGNMNVLNGTILGRDEGYGYLSISNGSYKTGAFNSSYGMFIGGAGGILSSANSNGTGLVTIGNGGALTLTTAAVNPFSFAGVNAEALNTSTSFLNFTTDSTGSLTLNLSTATSGASYFNNLIANGFVQIGGSIVTDSSLFTINTSNLSAATLGLLVPEPST